MKKLSLWLCFLLVNCGVGFLQAESAVNNNRVLLVDDFDVGIQTNRLGGIYGSDLESPGLCYFSLEGQEFKTFSQGGFSLKLSYDVSENGSFSFFWMKLGEQSHEDVSRFESIDINAYAYLSFWVRGEQGREKFKVELHQDTDGDGKYTAGKDISSALYMDVYLSAPVSKAWQKVVIPLKDFARLDPSKKLNEIVFVFENFSSIVKAGTVYVDHLLLGVNDIPEKMPLAASLENWRINGKIFEDGQILDNMNLIRVTLGGALPNLESVILEYSTDSGQVWNSIETAFADGQDKFSFFWNTIALNPNYEIWLRVRGISIDGQEVELGSSLKKLKINALTDDEIVDEFEKAIFKFFNEKWDPRTGLIADSSVNTFSSIAATGFGLTAWCIGVERKWIKKEEARERVLKVMDTFESKAFSKDGFFYHFLNMENAERYGTCEVSTIDTALLMVGMISAGEYFGGSVKTKAKKIYDRINWNAFINQKKEDSHFGQFSMGWFPGENNGTYIDSHWDYYSDEVVLISLLALGSESYPVDKNVFYNWKREQGEYQGHKLIQSWHGGLFAYQYANAWFDFRDIVDEQGVNWWQNAKEATLANKAFCLANASKFKTYEKGFWGITSFSYPRAVGDANAQGYVEDYTMNYGALPCGNGYPLHDGTISPTGAMGSIVFTPTESMDLLLKVLTTYPKMWGLYGLKDSFNLDMNWWSTAYYGIDLGISILMIENHRSGFVWKNFMKSSIAQKGLDKAGFKKKEQAKDVKKESDALVIEKKESPVVQSPIKKEEANVKLVAIQNFDNKDMDFAGKFGTWDKDPQDESQFCRMSLDDQKTHNSEGACLKLEYDVDSPNPAFNGFWMKLNGLDAQNYDLLVFWARAEADKPVTVKMELKGQGFIGNSYIREIGKEWQKISIPVSQFKGLKDLSQLEEFVIVFEDSTVMSKTGQLFIDDIEFQIR